MIMSELFIESHDLDWFAINDKNFIAHLQLEALINYQAN